MVHRIPVVLCVSLWLLQPIHPILYSLHLGPTRLDCHRHPRGMILDHHLRKWLYTPRSSTAKALDSRGLQNTLLATCHLHHLLLSCATHTSTPRYWSRDCPRQAHLCLWLCGLAMDKARDKYHQRVVIHATRVSREVRRSNKPPMMGVTPHWSGKTMNQTKIQSICDKDTTHWPKK